MLPLSGKYCGLKTRAKLSKIYEQKNCGSEGKVLFRVVVEHLLSVVVDALSWENLSRVSDVFGVIGGIAATAAWIGWLYKKMAGRISLIPYLKKTKTCARTL